MIETTYEALSKDSWLENQKTPGFSLSAAATAAVEAAAAAAAEIQKLFFFAHAELINSSVLFPSSTLPCWLPSFLTQAFLPLLSHS